jgi:phage tail-like protein
VVEHDYDRPTFAGRFRIEVDGVEIGTFQEVSGLSVQMKIEEITEGGNNDFTHKMPGPLTWPNITLKRGVTRSDELFEWFNQVSATVSRAGGLERRNGSITALDEHRDQVRQWNFTGAVPVRWKGPDFSASGNGIAVEELEIAHHGFTSGS